MDEYGAAHERTKLEIAGEFGKMLLE